MDVDLGLDDRFDGEEGLDSAVHRVDDALLHGRIHVDGLLGEAETVGDELLDDLVGDVAGERLKEILGSEVAFGVARVQEVKDDFAHCRVRDFVTL